MVLAGIAKLSHPQAHVEANVCPGTVIPFRASGFIAADCSFSH